MSPEQVFGALPPASAPTSHSFNIDAQQLGTAPGSWMSIPAILSICGRTQTFKPDGSIFTTRRASAMHMDRQCFGSITTLARVRSWSSKGIDTGSVGRGAHRETHSPRKTSCTALITRRQGICAVAHGIRTSVSARDRGRLLVVCCCVPQIRASTQAPGRYSTG